MSTFTEQLLEALPPPGDPVTIGALAKKLNGENRRVVRSIDVLRRRGLVERLETGLYRLTPSGEQARHDGAQIKSGPKEAHTGRARRPAPFRAGIWKVLRFGEATTVPDLLSLIPENDHGKAPRSNAHKYLSHLVEAGFVIELPTRDPGTAVTSNGFKRFRLINDTGPKAPYWSWKEQRVIDPNRMEEADG